MRAIPTVKDLYLGIKSELEAAYGIVIIVLGKVFLNALSGVQAAKLKLFYLALAGVQKNIFVDTADPEASGGTLERFGRVKIGRNPYPAVAAQYHVQITGTIGATIPASTTFKSNDASLNAGQLYVLDSAYTLVSSPDTIVLRALVSGSTGKQNYLDTLTATAPLAGVNAIATIEDHPGAEVVTPLDAETIEAYRSVVINSYALEPQGGSAVDYRLWSQDAAGVKTTYPYAKSGAPNEINLFVEATIGASTDGFGTPGSTLLTAVQAVVELNPDTSLPITQRGRRPLGVFQIHYLPVTIRVVNITLNGFPSVTVPVKNQITQAITDAINSIRPYVSAADLPESKNDILDLNKIISVVLTARPGSVFSSVSITVDGVSVIAYTFLNGDIPHLNSVTYA